jgi:hypothetical protein
VCASGATSLEAIVLAESVVVPHSADGRDEGDDASHDEDD